MTLKWSVDDTYVSIQIKYFKIVKDSLSQSFLNIFGLISF